MTTEGTELKWHDDTSPELRAEVEARIAAGAAAILDDEGYVIGVQVEDDELAELEADEEENLAAEAEIQRATPPISSIVHVHRAFMTHYRLRDDGMMEVIFTPAQRMQGGAAMMLTPQLVFMFPKESWDAFKAEIAADGVKAPAQQLATPRGPSLVRAAVMPTGPVPGHPGGPGGAPGGTRG
jgi:hypothetical protein